MNSFYVSISSAGLTSSAYLPSALPVGLLSCKFTKNTSFQ